MKKIIMTLLMLLCLTLPALAEDALPQGVRLLCEKKYPAYIIAAHDGWGNESRGQYALVLTTGEDNILCIAEKAEADSAYTFTVENPNALREGVCHGLIKEGDTLLQVDVQSEAILMLVRKADGTKRLRIAGAWNGDRYAVEDSVAYAFPQKHIKESLHGKTGIAKVPAGETFRTISGNSWYIIGVVDDGWYVIMTGDGAVGYQLQNAFWDGNG